MKMTARSATKIKIRLRVVVTKVCVKTHEEAEKGGCKQRKKEEEEEERVGEKKIKKRFK